MFRYVPTAFVACACVCFGRFSLRFVFLRVFEYVYACCALYSPLLPCVLDRFYRRRRSLRRSQSFTFEGGGTEAYNDFGFGDKDGYIDWTTNTTRGVRSFSSDFSRGFFLGLKTAMMNLELPTNNTRDQRFSPRFFFLEPENCDGDLEPCVTQGNRCYVRSMWLVFVKLEQRCRSESLWAQVQLTRKHQQCMSLNQHGSFQPQYRYPAYQSREKST